MNTNTTMQNATLAKFAQRENMPMVKTILEVTERRFYWSMKALESAQAAEREAQDADSAERAHAARLAAQREAREDAERYALALIRFSWGREESVLRRAYDNGASLYANRDRALNATPEQRKAAANCGANETVRRLKSEAPQDARRLILSAYDENAADVFYADRLSDAMDVLQEAALAVLETAGARAENEEAARADGVGVLDFKYKAQGDKRAACDVTRASRKAERYVNGRRGLALEDFRTLYYESWTEEQDAQEAMLLYKRGSIYASLANDTTIGAYDVKMIDSVLASLDLKPTQYSRLRRYVDGMTQAQIARADGVTEGAVSQTFDGIRAKVLKRIEEAAQRADSAAQGKGKRAQAAAQRAANYRKFAAMLEDIRARYEVQTELDAARAELAAARAELEAAQAAQAAQAQARAQAAAARLAELEAPALARSLEEAAADIARANYARRRLARKNSERAEREAARRRRLELANCAYWTRDRRERAEREAAALADRQEAARRAFARGTFAPSNCAELAAPARNAALAEARKAERAALAEAVSVMSNEAATSRAKMHAAARLERAERERAELEAVERAEREAAAERRAAALAELAEREAQDAAAQAAQAAQAQAAARCDFIAAQEAAAQAEARKAAQAAAQAAQLSRAARLEAAAAQAAAELDKARAELADSAARSYASAAERRAAIAAGQEAARLAREAMERAQEAARLAREFAEK